MLRRNATAAWPLVHEGQLLHSENHGIHEKRATQRALPLVVSNHAGTEKFIFDNETVCVIYYAGELTLVAYGRNEILGVCRTEHVHPTLLSVVAQQV